MPAWTLAGENLPQAASASPDFRLRIHHVAWNPLSLLKRSEPLPRPQLAVEWLPKRTFQRQNSAPPINSVMCLSMIGERFGAELLRAE